MSTYTPIASVTLSSAQSSVTFSGIPQTYTDLIVVFAGAAASGDYNIILTFNSDTGSNYSWTDIEGNGSTAASYRLSNQTGIKFGYNLIGTSTSQCNTIMHIMNYSNTTTFKTALGRVNSATAPIYAGTSAGVGLWRNTNAITSVTIQLITENFNSGSTFNLYGVANASITNVAKATGGDSVYTDGTYWYHIFRSSGTFTPTQALTADYLVVAGGGGGGYETGGGGGAGGLRCTVGATGGGGSVESALSLTAQAYTVTIGAGGAGSTSTRGISGSNSVFSTITATGGGGGGTGSNPVDGINGGSGGGAARGGTTAGTGTANQGYAGGIGGPSTGSNVASAGGGGGAGVVGTAGASGQGGAGGNGISTSISGTSTTYAGGGGGGAYVTTRGLGGSGGGGNGGDVNGLNGVDAVANTGGGGGGGGLQNTAPFGGNGGAGGSGIVIVRYSAA